MNQTEKPDVTLVYCPRDIIRALHRLYMMKTCGVYQEIVNDAESAESFKHIIKSHHDLLEHVSLTWWIRNVSEAMLQQLQRHRIGFQFMEMQRRLDNIFASTGRYHRANVIKDKEAYNATMGMIQDLQNEMFCLHGVDAAMYLKPMNAHSDIVFTCNLRVFAGMLNKRLCLKVQGEFRHVAILMMKELEQKVSPEILDIFGEPCRFGPCIVIPENEQQLAEGKLFAEQNTNMCCVLYTELFAKDRVSKDDYEKAKQEYKIRKGRI